MKWIYFSLILLLGCNKTKTVEYGKGLDSTKYDGMYLGANYEVAGTFTNQYFLLTICHYKRYQTYKDWWIMRYNNITYEANKDYLENLNIETVVYYELIDLSSSFKPKKIGKLCCSNLSFEKGERVTYYSDTTKTGFAFEVIRRPMSLKREYNGNGLLIEKSGNSMLTDDCLNNNDKCFFGTYERILGVPYRIITDEEINDSQTQIKNEEFMLHIKKMPNPN